VRHPLRNAIRIHIALLVAVSALPSALAQPSDNTPDTGQTLLTADEENLWIVQASATRSRVAHRSITGEFEPQPALKARLARITNDGDTLYAFTDNGEFWSFVGGKWRRQLDLPGGIKPISFAGLEHILYALVPTVSTTQPNEDAAPLTLMRYDNRGWIAIAPAPPTADPDRPLGFRPQLAAVQGALAICWTSPEMNQVHTARFDLETQAWAQRAEPVEVRGMIGCWLTTVSRVPMLVVASGTRPPRLNAEPADQPPSGQPTLQAFRLLGEGAEATKWRPADLALTPVPEGMSGIARCVHADGFNQHVVLLMRDAAGDAYLRFGRVDAKPTETSRTMDDVLSPRPAVDPRLSWLQGITFLILIAVLLTLFVFRRGAMVTAAPLPAEMAPALSFQRLGGFAIDFVPLALLVALIVGVNAETAFRELLGWAFGSDAAAGKFPADRTLMWWAICGFIYAAYSLLMELTLGRTIGKFLTGTRVVNDNGERARAGQILMRNGVRLLELIPPLWVLGFLVVLSRNRQRLGDIFGRTVVVRRVRVVREQHQESPPPDGDDET
jgi:uncharacterized RDD family membrane protein YckC